MSSSAQFGLPEHGADPVVAESEEPEADAFDALHEVVQASVGPFDRPQWRQFVISVAQRAIVRPSRRISDSVCVKCAAGPDQRGRSPDDVGDLRLRVLDQQGW